MNHDEQFHEAIVDVARGGGLQDEDILVADRLADRNTCLLIRVVEAHGVGDINAKSATASANCWVLNESVWVKACG